jgi:L-ribulose-5-phosphate 3-epimerase
MFKIGTLADWFKVGVLDGIRTSKQVNAQGVQLYAWDKLHPDNITDEFIQEVKQVALENNQEIVALCGELGGHGFEIKEDNKAKVDYLNGVTDIAIELGCKIVTTHIGRIPDDKSSERYQNMLEACQKVAKYAASKNVVVAIETGPEKIKNLVEFIKKCETPGIGINYDPGNLVMVTKEDEVEGIYTGKDYIVHTHAKDGICKEYLGPEKVYEIFATGGIEALNKITDYFVETPLGQGEVKWDAYLKALKDIGYEGFLTIEREVGDNAKADVELAVDFLNEKIRKL